LIVDTSALIAILRDEPDAAAYAAALAAADHPLISAANYLETAIVVDASRDPIASRNVDQLVAKAGLTIEACTAEQAKIARAAYRDFGKGQRSPGSARFRRLFRLRPGHEHRRATVVQGQ